MQRKNAPVPGRNSARYLDSRIPRPGRQLPRLIVFSTLILGAALLWRDAIASQPAPWQRMPAVQALLGDSQVVTRGLTLDLPLVSEDGSAVALTVAADTPVEAIHLFATRNPNPEIAVFKFSAVAGAPRVSTRVRLNETQTVVALARTQQGQWLATSREVRITTSGCLVRDDSRAGDDEMVTRIRVPARVRAGQAAEVLALINHPMETGLREGADGTIIPRRVIEKFSLELNGEIAFEAQLFPAIAANPFLRVHLAAPQSGTLVFRWTEDTGRSVSEQAELTIG